MLRNKEFKRYLLVLLVLGALGVGACFVISLPAGIVATALFLSLGGLNLVFTRRRYRDIAHLSLYLGRVVDGDYSLDFRDFGEGELSILKSEIYKVTKTLSFQAQHLTQDKIFLADAISDISHQLRTPLTSISVMTELLSDPNLPEEKRREFVGNISLGLDRVRWLVESLLKLAKMDAGAIRFKRETVDGEELIRRATRQLLIPMEIKEQTLELSVQEGIVFQGDMDWSAEAVGNIVKNCVEHTPEGGTIRIACAKNPLYTAITIKDNGPGIAAEDLPHIFERFYRGKNAGKESVGIGLAMSKSIIRSQGGDVTVRNLAEGGCIFDIRMYNNR